MQKYRKATINKNVINIAKIVKIKKCITAIKSKFFGSGKYDNDIAVIERSRNDLLPIRLGRLPERPYPILSYPSPHEERDRERSFCKERNLPSRIPTTSTTPNVR